MQCVLWPRPIRATVSRLTEARRDMPMWPGGMRSLAGYLRGDMVDDRRQGTQLGQMPHIWTQNPTSTDISSAHYVHPDHHGWTDSFSMFFNLPILLSSVPDINQILMI